MDLFYTKGENELLIKVGVTHDEYLEQGGNLDDWDFALVIDGIYTGDQLRDIFYSPLLYNSSYGDHKVYHVNGKTIIVQHH